MAKNEFRVALNPLHPEANSWWSPSSRVNLSLSPRRDPKSTDANPIYIKDTGPISQDLSDVSDLDDIKRGIQSGLLIVATGDLPDGIEIAEIPYTNSPRARWNPDLAKEREAALANHRQAIVRAKSAAAKAKAEATK